MIIGLKTKTMHRKKIYAGKYLSRARNDTTSKIDLGIVE